MKLGNNENKKRKKNPPKAIEEKKERQRSLDFTRKARKCNRRLMYKTKGVGTHPKGTDNTLKVLTQCNP